MPRSEYITTPGQSLPFERAAEEALAAIFATGADELAGALYLAGHRDLAQRVESATVQAADVVPDPGLEPVVVFFGTGYARDDDGQDSCEILVEVRTPVSSLAAHDRIVQGVRAALSADNARAFGAEAIVAQELAAVGLASLQVHRAPGAASISAVEPERACFLHQHSYRATGALLTA